MGPENSGLLRENSHRKEAACRQSNSCKDGPDDLGERLIDVEEWTIWEHANGSGWVALHVRAVSSRGRLLGRKRGNEARQLVKLLFR